MAVSFQVRSRPLFVVAGGVVALALTIPSGTAAAVDDLASGNQTQVAQAYKQTTNPGQTKKTKTLNGLLKGSSKGVLVRSIPDDSGTDLLVASWTRNDIKAPNAMYPGADPWCGPRIPDAEGYGPGPQPWGDNSFINELCNGPNREAEEGVPPGANSFKYASVGLVSKKVGKLNVGTWYPTDANVVDGRAAYVGLDSNGEPIYDFPVEGPDGTYTGGAQDDLGRGCHADNGQINQTDSRVPGTDRSLVADYQCQCQVDLSGNNWQRWINQWLEYADVSSISSPPPYFTGNDPSVPFQKVGGVVGKAPMYALDWASCWLPDRNDLVSLQNGLWFSRAEWWNGLIPFASKNDWNQGPNNPGVQKLYWGWNEIPVQRSIDQRKNWAAMLIKLPAGAKNLGSLNGDAVKKAKKDLKAIINEFDVPLGNKKKSAVVLLTEKQTKPQEYKRKFKCQGFKFGKNLRINYQKKTKKQKRNLGHPGLVHTSDESNVKFLLRIGK